jgi:hypothetical protein
MALSLCSLEEIFDITGAVYHTNDINVAGPVYAAVLLAQKYWNRKSRRSVVV